MRGNPVSKRTNIGALGYQAYAYGCKGVSLVGWKRGMIDCFTIVNHAPETYPADIAATDRIHQRLRANY